MKYQKLVNIFISGILMMSLISSAHAQTTPEAMTNAKVIELVKMGLSEALIVSKISKSECQCDTSTTAIAKLKAAKVSDTVIMAMMDATPGGFSDSRPSKESGTINWQPKSTIIEYGTAKTASGEKYLSQISEPGIYLLDNGKMTLIEPTVYSGSKSSFWGTALTYGIKKSKIKASVRGKSANTQVTSGKPEFYFVFSREYANSGAVMSGIGGYAATSPNEFMMISMTVKENSREATLGEVSAYTSSTGAQDKDIREYSFERIKPGIYKVVPKINLTPGEYAFYYAGNGGAGGKVFDFGVK